jgi:hypothetical protein
VIWNIIIIVVIISIISLPFGVRLVAVDFTVDSTPYTDTDKEI